MYEFYYKEMPHWLIPEGWGVPFDDNDSGHAHTKRLTPDMRYYASLLMIAVRSAARI